MGKPRGENLWTEENSTGMCAESEGIPVRGVRSQVGYSGSGQIMKTFLLFNPSEGSGQRKGDISGDACVRA